MKDNWNIKIDQNLSAVDKKGNYIILQKVNQTPPHIGVISQGNYISLSAKGIQHKSVDHHFALLKRSQTPCILFKIDLPVTDFESIFVSDCNSLAELTEGITCLQPLKNSLYQIKKDPAILACNYIFELIPLLSEWILLTESLHLTTENFELPKYNMEDIQSCIKKYKDDKR